MYIGMYLIKTFFGERESWYVYTESEPW